MTVATNRCLDFINQELYLDLGGENDSVSSLGSICSFEEEDSDDDESLSSNDAEDLLVEALLQRKKKSPKRNLSSTKLLHRHHPTSPDLKLSRVQSMNSKAAVGNARWISETTRTFSNMSITPPGSRSSSMRKSRSLEDEKNKKRNDRWTSSSSHSHTAGAKSSSARHKITNEILDLSGNTWGSNGRGSSGSGSSGNRWSATPPQLLRAATLDHAPRIPTSSLSDLNNIRRCKTDEPQGNERWGATTTRASHPPTLSSPPRHSSRRRPCIRDSAPDLFRRRSHNKLLNHPEDLGSPVQEKNAIWTSRAGSRSPRSSSGDLSSCSKGGVPVRALSRWNSSSSFTVTSMSCASIDQLSTKPQLPRRRPRRGSAARQQKKQDNPPAKEQKSGEELPLLQVACVEQRREGKDQEQGQETTPNDETAKAETIPKQAVEAVAGPAPEEAQDTHEESKTEEATSPEEAEPNTDSVGLLQDDTSGLEGDDSSNNFHLRYAMPPCMECFETIPEESNEDEMKSPPAPLLHHHQFSDSLLRAPKRRKSASSVTYLEDDSELSTSLRDTSSVSIMSLKDSSSSYLAVRDHVVTCGSKRSCGEQEQQQDLACSGPRQPRRRGSDGSHFGLESSCSSAESSQAHNKCMHRRTSPHPSCSRPCRRPSPRAPPRPVRRLSSNIGSDEKHPFSDLSGSTGTAVTAASSPSSSSVIKTRRPPALLHSESFPLLHQQQRESSSSCSGTSAKNPDAAALSNRNCPAA